MQSTEIVVAVNAVISISEELNRRLQLGEDEAFAELENNLKQQFNVRWLRVEDVLEPADIGWQTLLNKGGDTV